MYAGDNITLNFTAFEEDGVTPLNLTGLDIKYGLARSAGEAPLFMKTVGSGITVTNAAAGQFSVALAPADTLKFNGDYYHEAKVYEASKPYTVFSGSISFEPTILH